MHKAAFNNAVDVMKWMKSRGISINMGDPYGKTPMYYAARGKCCKCNGVVEGKWS